MCTKIHPTAFFYPLAMHICGAGQNYPAIFAWEVVGDIAFFNRARYKAHVQVHLDVNKRKDGASPSQASPCCIRRLQRLGAQNIRAPNLVS